MVSVGDIGAGRAEGEGGEEKKKKKKRMDPLVIVMQGDGRANCHPKFRDTKTRTGKT